MVGAFGLDGASCLWNAIGVEASLQTTVFPEFSSILYRQNFFFTQSALRSKVASTFMNELIDQLTEKAGITEDQAHKAVEVIKEYITSQLPPMMQGMVDNFLKSGNQSAQADDFLG